MIYPWVTTTVNYEQGILEFLKITVMLMEYFSLWDYFLSI